MRQDISNLAFLDMQERDPVHIHFSRPHAGLIHIIIATSNERLV